MPEEISVLIIDDDIGFCQTLYDILNEKGFVVEYANNGADALAKIEHGSFNVALIDVNLPDVNGIELFKEIKQKTPDIEGIIVTGYASIESAVAAVRYGTVNYVMKPLVVEDVLSSIKDAVGRQQLLHQEQQRLSKEREEKEHYQTLATVDGLTGLYNSRYFHEMLNRELSRAEAYATSLSVFMIDIDDFKTYQDPYGHLVGDTALQYIASIMSRAVRSEDIVARYGGEEFVVILPDVNKTVGGLIAERIRRAVESAKGPLKGPLTVSIGVATYPGDATEKQELIQKADDALYAAKRAGKNKTVLWNTDTESARADRP